MQQKMIRSVKIHSPINKDKLINIKEFLVIYNNCVNYFIKRLWSEKKFNGKFLDRNYILNAKERFPDLTMRLIQCAGKEALQNVKSQRELSKRQQRMPRFKKLSANLDSRFWKISDNKNSFEWLIFKSGFNFNIPFNKSSVWTNWEQKGFELSKSIRLKIINDKLYVEFIFEKLKPPLKQEGAIEGIDLGYVDVINCSNGQIIGKNINETIKSFDKHEKHTHEQIKNSLYHELKDLKLDNIKVLAIERLRSVKSGTRGMFPRKHNRRLSHWLYAKTTQWLEQHCEELGIRLEFKSPYKTSQYCRLCGKWDRRNRKGKLFKCVNCGHEDDADMNSAQNMKLLGLAEVYSLRWLPNHFYNFPLK